MIQRLVLSWITFLGGFLLFSCICTSNAMADRYQDIEHEANIRSQSRLPNGWIDSISSESIIIDDTYYRFDDETRFRNARRKFIEGAFVEFELREENFVAIIGIAEPLEKDMYMKPMVRSKSKPLKNKVDKPQDAPRLENGVWVY